MLAPTLCGTTVLRRDIHADRIARRAVQGVLRDAPIEPVRDALLLTSELVSNAIRHTPGDCCVAAHYWPHERRLRVDVSDESSHLPTLPKRPSAEALSGRGMRLLDDIASAWGCTPTPSGKIVWFELQW
ncbi:MAG: ATP-binding protein [Actinomycetota bacterium]|nr:ATP-binding protein [Actinomycetota bacterium]